MDNSLEKESSEIKFIRSHTKTISEIEDPQWVFSGKPNNKPQNNDMSETNFEKHSIKNLLNSKSIEIEKMIEIITPETLQIDSHLLDYPYSAIGIINISFTDNSNQIGCGTLIMPGVVLTCANLICEEKKEISKIKFYCNYDEIQGLFKLETEAEGFFFPDDFENGFPFEDYAILVLKKPVGRDTGYLGILPFNNLDRNVDFIFCSFDFLKDESVINFLDSKKIKKLEMEENEANLSPKKTYKKSKNLIRSETAYFGEDNKNDFFDFDFKSNSNNNTPAVNTKTYFYPETFEGEIRIKENIIHHKYKIFNKIPGCPIFIENDKLSFLNIHEESMKNKNNPTFIYPSNSNLNLNNSMMSISDSINNKNKNKDTKITGSVKPEFYLVGICTGKSDNIFNRSTLICRKRFENIKSWITNYSGKSGKIQKQMVLNMESNYIDDMFIENIPKIDLEKITNLVLRNNSIRVDGVASIAKSNFKNLIELDLSKNDIKDSGLKIICENILFKNLETLNISNNNISRTGAGYLVNSKIKALKSLDLANNNLREDGIMNLFFGMKNILANIEFLNLTNNKLLNKGIFNLAESNFENIKSIKHLNLSLNRITNEGLIKFSKCNKFYNLITLNLSHNTLTHESLKELANAQFGNLKELILSENKIGDEGAINLANGKLFSLQNLMLENCEITDFGLFNILKGNFPYLENFNLKLNKITDKGAGFIIDSQLMFLKNLNLQKNKIGSDGRMTLSQVKNCNVIMDQ